MSLKNKVIVILGNTRFNGSIQSTSFFIARSLAADNEVYFIEYPFTIKDYLKNRDAAERKSRKKDLGNIDGLISTELPNLKIISIPPVIPINFLPEGGIYRMMLKFNEQIICRQINRVLKQKEIKDFIYINAFNFHFPGVAACIKPALTIYQCVDPMIVPYDIKHGITSENELVKKSDLVICTSKALYDEKRQQNPKTFLVPNAADTDHCAKALDPALPVHPKIASLPKPVVGYIGSIERRMDYPLLTSIVQSNPDKTFVLAGPYWAEYIPPVLFNTPNVHFTGPIPYNELPQLVKGFDVTIIPFKKDEVSPTIFPLKLFEFLAAGKPVVATDFNPDLANYTDGTVSFCTDDAAFNEAINHAIADGDNGMEKRIAVAARNSWEKRAGELGDIIAANLKS